MSRKMLSDLYTSSYFRQDPQLIFNEESVLPIFLLTAKQHINEADSPTKPFPYRSSLFITNSTGLQILVVLDSFGFCPADGQNLRLDDCVICVKHQGSRSCPILALIHIKLVSPAAKQSTFVYPFEVGFFPFTTRSRSSSHPRV